LKSPKNMFIWYLENLSNTRSSSSQKLSLMSSVVSSVGT
jgi:hypothetical protein